MMCCQGSFNDHNSGELGKWPDFSSIHFIYSFFYFSTFIFVFQNGKNSYSCSPTCGPLLSAKFLNFTQELLIQTIHHTILKSGQPQGTNNSYNILSLKRSRKTLLACVLRVTKKSTWLERIIFKLFSYPIPNWWPCKLFHMNNSCLKQSKYILMKNLIKLCKKKCQFSFTGGQQKENWKNAMEHVLLWPPFYQSIRLSQ